MDFKNNGVILDDDILAHVIQPLPAGVDLFCVTDCCHSGTLMDLPYTVAVDSRSGMAIQSGMLQQLGANQKFYNKGARRDGGNFDGENVGCAAMLGGIGLCCADCFDVLGDSDKKVRMLRAAKDC